MIGVLQKLAFLRQVWEMQPLNFCGVFFILIPIKSQISSLTLTILWWPNWLRCYPSPWLSFLPGAAVVGSNPAVRLFLSKFSLRLIQSAFLLSLFLRLLCSSSSHSFLPPSWKKKSKSQVLLLPLCPFTTSPAIPESLVYAQQRVICGKNWFE